MAETGGNVTWTGLAGFRGRFDYNVRALADRDPALADRIASHCPKETYSISAAGDTLRIGVGEPGAVSALPNPVPAGAARQIVAQLTQSGNIAGPVIVAGLDQGWLWDALARLSVNVPVAPGHRPPVYLLAREIERLWLVLHLHDWRQLLADPRCVILAGVDATTQLQRYLVEHPQLPWPRINVTVDQQVWPQYSNLDVLLSAAGAQLNAKCADLFSRISAAYANHTPAVAADKLKRGGMKVLGLTSRFTTFLQHSMRDWLEAMESLGNQTRLVIEHADHEKLHPVTYLTAIDEFLPDVIFLIDHYRAEFPLMPSQCPCVMWVQDRLPNIFCTAAGEAQGPMDFVIGHGRRDCVTDFAFPRARFMEAPVGVNEKRFCADELDEQDLTPHRTKISFVSHASATPEALIQEQIDKQPIPEARRLFGELHDRLCTIYARGEFVTQEKLLHTIVDQSMVSAGVSLPSVQPLADFVTQKLNNAFFRHQVLHWLVDAGFEPALYGKGWENHPKFARFARGVADNQKQLAAIYHASEINLQITPFGSAHQRLFEGLCAGGFFLLRSVTADAVEPLYIELWDFCQAHGIVASEQLRTCGSARITSLLHTIEGLTGEHPLAQRHDFLDGLRAVAQSGFLRTSSTIWPEYADVAFNSRQQLLDKVNHFLANVDQRQFIADSMRQRVLRTVTYQGTCRRMIDFMTHDLAARNHSLEAAA